VADAASKREIQGLRGQESQRIRELQEELKVIIYEREELRREREELRKERDVARKDAQIYKSMAEEKDKAIGNLRDSVRQQKEEIVLLEERLAVADEATQEVREVRVEVSDPSVVEERDRLKRDSQFMRAAMEEKDKEIKTLRRRSTLKPSPRLRPDRDASKAKDEQLAMQMMQASLDDGMGSRRGSEVRNRNSSIIGYPTDLRGSMDSRNSQTLSADMLEVDLTGDMSPPLGNELVVKSRSGSLLSQGTHVSVDLQDSDEEFAREPTIIPIANKRLSRAGF
jgi:multidrug efflux pump subunit AcrB